jgi:hypothetical protein
MKVLHKHSSRLFTDLKAIDLNEYQHTESNFKCRNYRTYIKQILHRIRV